MDEWKQNILKAKRMLSRSNQPIGKCTTCKCVKDIKPRLSKVVNEVMKDSDSDTDNEDEEEYAITNDAAGKRCKSDATDLEWDCSPWSNCAQPHHLDNRTISINRRGRFNVIVTCNNGRTTRRGRGRTLFEEIYLALSDRDEYVELERQINAAVASYKRQDVRVPRRFLKAQMPILAPFADSYYRGRVIAVNKSRCKVFFVDYGNEEDNIPTECIYPMQLHFSLLPPMAFAAWIPAGPSMLQEGAEFAVIIERIGKEGIVQVRRYGPHQSLDTINEMDELDDAHVDN